MPKSVLARLSHFHSRLAPAVFVIPSLFYLATWHIEPYLYACTVLGLAPVQLAWFVFGLALAPLRTRMARRVVTLVVSGLGAASAVLAFAFLKSINWA